MHLKIKHHGKDRHVWVEKVNQQFWFHLDGETHVIDPVKSHNRRNKGPVLSSDQVLAPMPGKITKLMVKANDSVVQGQVVLVMEAMKMEYTLKAEIEGVVSEVLCELNEQVPVGKKLMQLAAKV